MILDVNQTRKTRLPYQFDLMPNRKVRILNLRGQVLYVTRGEVEHILLRDDLDVHRRRMYEAALEIWKKAETQQ